MAIPHGLPLCPATPKGPGPWIRSLALGLALLSAACGGGGGGGSVPPKPNPTTWAPRFTQHPQDQLAADGAQATFTATATGSPAPVLQWQVQLPGASTWSDAAGATGGTFMRVAAYAEEGLRVRVLATNSEGTATSLEAKLSLRHGWTASPHFPWPRTNHTATPLLDGRVLLVGGWEDGNDAGVDFAPTQIYDPATGAYSPAPSPTIKRGKHGAVRLADGRVMIIGGLNINVGNPELYFVEIFDPVTSTWETVAGTPATVCYTQALLMQDGRVFVMAERQGVGFIFDPATGLWTITPRCLEPTTRFYCSLALLKDGRVLLVGGTGSGSQSSFAEMYDPATNTWIPAGTLPFPTSSATATRIADGRVIVAGGNDRTNDLSRASAALFDPATRTWSSLPPMALPRRDHQSIALPDGRLLVSCGTWRGFFDQTGTQELFDPATGSWSSGPSLAFPRKGHTLSLLPNGDVAILGGWDRDIVVSSLTEVYRPGTGALVPFPKQAPCRAFGTTTVLADGQVLLAGGGDASKDGFNDSRSYLQDAFLMDPATGDWRPTGSLVTARGSHHAVRLPSGKVVVLGGLSPAFENVLRTVEVYDPATGIWTQGSELLPYQLYGWEGMLPSNSQAIPLDDGRVLVLGTGAQTLLDPESGTFTPPETRPLLGVGARTRSGKVFVLPQGSRTPMLFDPALGTWSPAAAMPGPVPQFSTAVAVPLKDGRVLVLEHQGYQTNFGLVYDPAKDTWTTTLPWTVLSNGAEYISLNRFSYTVLEDGTVLGTGTMTVQYHPSTNAWEAGPSPSLGRNGSPNLAHLPDGRTLLFGGLYWYCALGHPEYYR